MPPLTITLIQPDLRWEDKTANLELLGTRIDAIAEKTHLVILPEMFSTGFSMRPEALAEPMNGPAVTWMKQMAARKKVILTGSLIIEEKGRYFNPLATPEQLQFICQVDQFAAKAALEARQQELARSGDQEKACKAFAETIFSTSLNLLKQNPIGQAYIRAGNQAQGLPPPVFKPVSPTGQMNQLI